ncbi:MAG TPA: hypothetical protein VHQ01_00735 [Pyrinomonadaceae bacterium]|nr:hypothetical protein [Pyrinomonadaceae bacterium]
MVKRIPLTKGRVALVDDEDYEFLMQWKWYCNNDRAVRSMSVYKNGKRKQIKIQMSRIINKTPKGLETDHSDRNTLNNQKYNLRNATEIQNQMNAEKPNRPSTSKYKGVTHIKGEKRCRTRISINKKRISVGWYDSELEAAIAYNVAALEHHGEFARLNDVA